MSKAMEDVLAERRQQIEVKGWTAEYDDEHEDGDLALAGACYAAFASCYDNRQGLHSILHFCRNSWPWGRDWWKPKGDRRNLVRAAALIIAEIEKLDRAEHAPQVPLADAGDESTMEPYPTAWAYEQVCKAFNLAKERIEELEAVKSANDMLLTSDAENFAELESQLAAEREARQADADAYESVIRGHEDQFAKANEARQAAEKDAARYRWLRKNSVFSWSDGDELALVVPGDTNTYNYEDDADAAIDAAMKKENGNV